jgi:transposase
VIHPVCCGIDGHAAQLTACLRRVSDDGQITTELVDGGTTSRALIALRTWGPAQQCPVVAMERTGVYWKPVSHVLSAVVEVCVAQSQDVRQRPGTKTDESEATWMAELLAPGLIQPSFVPPPAMRAWRDLTRTRVSLVQTRTQAQNRVSKIVEDTNIQLASVVSDVCGKRARRMLVAWVAGERDAAQLAVMALRSVRRQMPQLAVALAGQCTAHHAQLMVGALELVDVRGRQMVDMDQQLQAWLGPMAPQLEPLDRMPGVNASTARDILAEMGLARTRCGSASRRAAWAGWSPGTNDSAGKRRQGRTRRGHRSLRRVLVQCAGATRKTSPFVGRTCRRLEARWGGKKAAGTVAQKMLVIIDPLLLEGTFDEEERDDRLWPRQEERARQRARKALERMGYAVTLEKGA